MIGFFLIGCIAIHMVPAQVYDPCVNREDGYFRADPAACENYFTCFEKVSYPQTCPTDYFFRESTQSCVPDSTVCVPAAECPPTGVVFIPATSSCADYLLCINGAGTPLTCGNGFLFDPTIQSCNTAANVSCVVNSCPPAPGTAFIPSNRNCNEYFICLDGQPQLQNCIKGFHFDITKDRCVLAADYVCPVAAPVSISISVFRTFWICIWDNFTVKTNFDSILLKVISSFNQ